MAGAVTQSRRDDLAANLARLEARIAAACRAAGRARDDITVIAVTKTYPAADIVALGELGLTDFGENRAQEAARKVAEVAELRADVAGVPGVPRWHFIGALQTNKCRSVVGYADVVHSVDRAALVGPLGRAASEAKRVVDCLVQADLDPRPRPERAGAAPAEVAELADLVAATPGLRLAGVMTVAPLGGDPAHAFGELARLADDVRARHPQARVISAGMSGDFEIAIANGATHLRVGAALLGSRPHPG